MLKITTTYQNEQKKTAMTTNWFGLCDRLKIVNIICLHTHTHMHTIHHIIAKTVRQKTKQKNKTNQIK